MFNRRGFTLIELLIVIAIIGILAGIILASLQRAKTAALDSKRLQEFRQVKTAMELYYINNGQYPTLGVSLPPVLQSFGTECWNGDCYFNVSGTSIKDTTRLQTALSSFWNGNPDTELYIYKVDPSGKNYKLFSFLENTSAIPGSTLDSTFFSSKPGDGSYTFNVPGPMGAYVGGTSPHGISISSSEKAATWNIYCTFDGSSGNACAQ